MLKWSRPKEYMTTGAVDNIMSWKKPMLAIFSMTRRITKSRMAAGGLETVCDSCAYPAILVHRLPKSNQWLTESISLK